MTQVLAPLTLPLWGSRLIEASAGTGKTWTIAALYLRLVLGHGEVSTDGAGDDHTAFARPLIPSEILVMTFTRAATRELSDRIRARLLQAARCFRGEAQPDASDVFLIDLLAAYEPGKSRNAAAWRLAMAAESMDDAAVHTIDAWCQRMLREHAFDSGCLFDEELTANEQAMQIEAAQDYWRQQLYPLSGDPLDVALSVWASVDKLAKDARALIEQPLPVDAGKGSLGALIEALAAERMSTIAALKVGWAEKAQEMKHWIDAQIARNPNTFKARLMVPANYTRWLNSLHLWASGPNQNLDELKKAVATGVERFTPVGMRKVFEAGVSIDLPADFAEFAQLMQALDALPPLAPRLRLHAASRIAQRLAELKQQSGSFGFADMLTRLDRALDPAANGEAATRLRERMLAQYPVALIDEFQDTSPVQSRIFDRLYRIADNARDTGLLLIGDPKQSIYGFRGADIHSYLKARRATEGRHYVLGTNHRSTAAVVAAVNHLLATPEQREGEGAFMYRQAASESGQAPENPLPFLLVEARGRAEVFVTSEAASAAVASTTATATAAPAVTLVLDSELVNGDTARRRFAARCAERIVSWLNDPGAGFAHPQTGFARLRPADIAVLVRSGKEAAAVQRELRRRQVASVYLSDKESVFASAEAQDLLRWLQAVASSRDVRLARAALATRTVGLSITELLRLARDDEAFDLRGEQLRQLHGVWQGQGVLTMLRRTLHLLDLPARWLGAASDDEQGEQPDHGGERRLTNFLHLAELLQAASAQLDGEQALIHWLTEQMSDDTVGNDEQIVRLESDADLVKVVTVHKSKGLEYPLVLLPFASDFRGVERANTKFVKLTDAQGQHSLHLHLSDAHVAAADKERHREDLRLLYVALTRARHAVWVGLSAIKKRSSTTSTTHLSAAGYAMHGTGAVEPAQLWGQVEALVAPCADIALVPATAMDALACSAMRPRGTPIALRHLMPYAAQFERQWSIGSFSALVRSLAPVGWSSSVAAVRDDEVLAPGEGAAASSTLAATSGASGRQTATPATPTSPDAQPWHRFPRGALAGNFLHDQLEWLAGEDFALDSAEALQQQLARRCERQGWGHRAPDVLAWLQRVVSAPLTPVGSTLVAIAAASAPVPELEFWLPSDGLPARNIDALCRQHLLSARDRPALPERDLRGMLMGFADLVFEHGGKYWVLDYKSNHLGATDADYTRDALEGAMAAHRYDVQAAIYLLALHRLLRARLGAGYDPAEHLGGAVYLFLRGIDGPERGCYHVAPHIDLLDALDQLLQHPQDTTEIGS